MLVLKLAQNFPKVSPSVTTQILLKKIFKMAKNSQNVWTTFVIKFSPRTLKNHQSGHTLGKPFYRPSSNKWRKDSV